MSTANVRKKDYKPSPIPGSSALGVQLWYPKDAPRTEKRNKKITASLGTSDHAEAVAICADLSRLANNPELWVNPKQTAAAGYNPAAFRIWFGFDPPIQSRTPVDIGLDELARQSKEWHALVEELREARRLLPLYRDRIEVLESENARLSRSQNRHVKVTLGTAVARWKKAYPQGRAKKTVVEATGAVDRFVASLPAAGAMPLGEVKAQHVRRWVEGLQALDGEGKPRAEPMSAVTKKKLRAYLSSFLSWAFESYDLVENPMAKAGGVAGVARHPENIKAIIREEHFRGYLDSFKEWPYWHALVSFACLTGLSEQEWMALTIDRVNIAGGYIQAMRPKTGRTRKVPIETSYLGPLLAEHLRLRAKQQRRPGSIDLPLFVMGPETEGAPEDPAELARVVKEADASAFVFPSQARAFKFARRTITEKGRWSQSSGFLSVWRRAVEAARAKAPEDLRGLPMWNFRPREWRHCAGTAMGHSGVDAMQICYWLDTSMAMCRRHYVAPPSAGRWGFRWS